MKILAMTALLITALLANTAAQDVKAVIADAARAMGVAGLTSIAYSGTAAIGNFGQSRTISFGLASTTIRNYTHAIDFTQDRKSTRLNSSHSQISYAVFCLKK